VSHLLGHVPGDTGMSLRGNEESLTLVMTSWKNIGVAWRSLASFAYGSRKNVIGLEFDRFGRNLGWRVLPRHFAAGINLVLHPVSSVRYFEFAFACGAVPTAATVCLDVSSPRLFSVYMASKRPGLRIRMINPDQTDVALTDAIVSVLGLRNVRCESESVADLLKSPSVTYDCIWSLSVVEHISGQYDDSWAVQRMYEVLKPGGYLILTVPVDRCYWEEYRKQDYYGTQQAEADGVYFFQRHYDGAAIDRRLLDPIGQRAARKTWFGERVSGHFADYERRWMREGLRYVVDDPREIADHYQVYGAWDDMPGRGVCGITIVKGHT